MLKTVKSLKDQGFHLKKQCEYLKICLLIAGDKKNRKKFLHSK